ncbi:MAG: UDP-N-acetylglucosamine 1-carboxyvinyltransferase [Thermodesulfobacteriota bacterium]|jgi:UDP-N-acetylglucosamine 1-carboxyvinyltransferase|nr:MAG: UDP-N-acetylglucosamine 1-carboxyvinyltransferase [Thermodesulfobacteriota bacterium]
MEKIIIQGRKKISGKVNIAGAKNAALPLMAASLLVDGWNTFSNVPVLRDIRTARLLLEHLGVEVKNGKEIQINAKGLHSYTAPYELVKTMRASILVLGPLLARLKQVKVSLPGGCAIGARPVDQHLKGFELMGVKIEIEHGYIKAKTRGLKGAKIYFDVSTVTGTENLMMAASLAKGTTILHNAAQEPEVVELAQVLNKMGAQIDGAGSEVITIEGVSALKPVTHEIMPDRIEAGTFLVAGALAGGTVEVAPSIPSHLAALLQKLEEANVKLETKENSITVKGGGSLKGANVTTLPFPGFPTDMQAQFMVLLSLSEGMSAITETVFENRFIHVSELQRMGADIEIKGNTAIVRGVKHLSGATVMASDLRASASLILAGLAARGTTEVTRIYHIDRGYEAIEEKLRGLGAELERVKDS